MIPSQVLSLGLVAAAGLTLASDPAQELRVLRVVPPEVASPGTVITVTAPPAVPVPRMRVPAARSVEEFRILSPSQGDVYRMPPGVDARYATVALRAAGGPANADVRWVVDGSPYRESRWPLQSGQHRFRAVSSAGDSAKVTVSVE